MNDRMKKSIEEYYKNPNICKFCNKVLMIPEGVKPSVIKKKKYCSKACWKDHYSALFPKKEKVKNVIDIENYLKVEIFKNCKNWQSARSMIQKSARTKYKNSDKPQKCVSCGYFKHYEVCHIKSVSSFDDNAKVKEINDINNLVALCPNCHWEFDNKILDVEKFRNSEMVYNG